MTCEVKRSLLQMLRRERTIAGNCWVVRVGDEIVLWIICSDNVRCDFVEICFTCLEHEAQSIQIGKSANLHAAFTAFSNLLFVLAVVYVYVCIYTCALAKRGWHDLLDGIRFSWFSSLLLQLRASPITKHPNLILPLLTKSFRLWCLKFLS